MSFLADFGEGFLTAGAASMADKKKRADDVDDYRKKKLAEVDPTAEVYKRNKEVEYEYEKQKQKDADERFLSVLNGGGAGTTPPATTPPAATGDGSFFGNMAPTGDKLSETHAKLQDAINKKSIAQRTGNKEAAAYFDTQIDLYKADYTYHSDMAKNDAKPVGSSEGTNIVDQIQKEADERMKNTTKSKSEYLPTKITGLLAQPEIQEIEKASVTKHAAIAQAVADATKKVNPSQSTAEVYPLVRDKTKDIVMNLNIVNSLDPRITPEDKKSAVAAIEKTITGLTHGDKNVLATLKADPNYAAIFDEQTVANINALMTQSLAAQPAAQESVAKPVELSTDTQIKEGATATNPKTGEKLVYRNGSWQPR